jgi:hypothetical protein
MFLNSKEEKYSSCLLSRRGLIAVKEDRIVSRRSFEVARTEVKGRAW